MAVVSRPDPAVVEQVGVAMAVPSGDAVAAEELDERVRRILAAQDDPEVDLVLAHQRQQMPPHLLRLEGPLALGPGAYQLGGRLLRRRRPHPQDEDGDEPHEPELPKRHPDDLWVESQID